MKIFLLVIAAFVVYWYIKSYGRKIQKPDAPKSEGAEDMVRCAHCGVHLPKSESILSLGNYFCSDEHRALHKR